MSSHPPPVIHVKRKRHEDGPVTFLRVEDNKRRQSGAWLYQRKAPNVECGDSIPPAPRDLKPVIHTSRQGDEARAINAIKTKPTTKTSALQGVKYKRPARPANDTDFVGDERPVEAKTEPRRFHMSRSDAATPTSSVMHGGVSKKSRYSPTVFVERGGKRKRVSLNTVRKLAQATAQAVPPIAPKTESTPDVDNHMEVDKPSSRPLKRPGVAKRAVSINRAPGDKPLPHLPASIMNRWDVDMDQLARDMNAYTLEQIGYTLSKLDDEKAKEATFSTSASSPPRKSKFRPKAPAKRWAERHPEVALREGTQSDELSQSGSDTDEEDYVMETYYRVPASSLGPAVPPEKVGLLVFDTEPDVQFFYGGGSDSEEEYGEEDEDENAENHYSVDYPDEEVESDDEYDRDAYHYRTRNASDLEEFDVAEIDDRDLVVNDAHPNEDEDGAFGERDPEAGRYNDSAVKNFVRSAMTVSDSELERRLPVPRYDRH